MILSPCISICKTDPVSGFCYGCGRTIDDKKKWKFVETSDKWKKENIIEIKKRLTGWQLKTFNKSYEYKAKNGISIYKKENIKIS
jgi:predicted Fe-S protein YdhL (DUF1289 family)|tara:strand:+ start:601 stop:855 length:255 start_codon:yes stop_codon:yes gene_type:complete